MDRELANWNKVYDIATYTGSVKSTTNKGPGFCFVAPSLPSSCFLGHVTGLFFCLYVKIFASSVCALFDY